MRRLRAGNEIMGHVEVESESWIHGLGEEDAGHLSWNQHKEGTLSYLKVHFFSRRTPETWPDPLGPALALLPVLGWAPAGHSCQRSGTMEASPL